jgi:hypothetical protein
MKHLAVFTALLLCGNVHAATYVYQANAYKGHNGRCGGALLPFQITITVKKAFPPDSNIYEPLKTISVSAGGKYQWERRFGKKHNNSPFFATDSNGQITAWGINGAMSLHTQVWSQNETGDVSDGVVFKCGAAGSQNDPGTWTRTN